MPSTMFVQNQQPGPTVLDEEGHETFRWEGKGDVNGGDVLPLPSDLVDSYNFQRAQMLGIVKVIEAPKNVEQQLQRARAAWQRQQQHRTNITLVALGQLPAEEGSVPQEFEVPVPSVGPGEIPETIDEEVGVITKGGQARPEITKSKVVMGPRGSYY